MPLSTPTEVNTLIRTLHGIQSKHKITREESKIMVRCHVRPSDQASASLTTYGVGSRLANGIGVSNFLLLGISLSSTTCLPVLFIGLTDCLPKRA